jgi:hypothetical protein
VQILTLPGRRPIYVGSRDGGSCANEYGGPISAVAVGDEGRVLWQKDQCCANTTRGVDLFTAAINAPRTRLVAALEFDNHNDDPGYPRYGQTGPMPMAADGDAIVVTAV